MKKLKISLILLVAISCLTACGSSNYKSDGLSTSQDTYYSGYSGEKTSASAKDKVSNMMANSPVSADISAGRGHTDTAREVTTETILESENEPSKGTKLIRTIRLTLESNTSDLQSVTDGIQTKVNELGGYVEQSNISKGNYNNTTTASIVIRVPSNEANKLLEFIESSNLEIESKSDNLTDVTLEYSDLSSRIKVLETQRDKYMDYLEQAENVAEVMEIESQLSEVLYQLESNQSRMNVLENKIDYTTITMSIRHSDYTAASFGERLVLQIKDSGRQLQDGILNLIDFLGYSIVQIIFLILCLYVIVKLIVACIRCEIQKYRDRKNGIKHKNKALEFIKQKINLKKSSKSTK